MKYLLFILIFLPIPFACQYSGFTDLTPDNGFKSEIAFNVLKLNEEISTTAEVQDSGWFVIEPIGAVRIIWGDSTITRAYPSTNTQDV